ncbi:MAG: hypothetical protein AAFX87_07985 [Bacteroidota bacterium]
MKKKELRKGTGKVYLTVQYDEENSWLYANWVGFMTMDMIKQGGLMLIEAVRESKCKHMLNDNREVEGTWAKANEWIATEWGPKIMDAGLRNFAMILSSNIFSEMSAKDLETKQDSFTMRSFVDIEDAKKWLKEQSVAIGS